MLEDLNKLIGFLQEITGVTLSKEDMEIHSYSGTVGGYLLRKELFQVYDSYQANDFEDAYHRAAKFLISFLEEVKIKDLEKNLKDYVELFVKSSEYYSTYADWANNDNVAFIDWLFQSSLLREEDKEDKAFKHLDRTLLKKARISVRSERYLRTHLKVRGDAVPVQGIKTSLIDKILFSDSLDVLINALQHRNDTIVTQILVKIEPIIDYSYFIIATTFKGSIWFTTDFIDFSNPRVASCSRNPRRRSEDRENALDLPYGVIDDLIEWRKDSTALKVEGVPEFYVKDIYPYLGFGTRVSIRILLEEILLYISEKGFDFPLIDTFKNLVESNVKLIGETNDSNVEDRFRQSPECREYVDDLIIPYPEGTTLPAVTSTSLMAQPEFRPDILLTPQAFDTHVAWFKHEQIYKQKQRALEDNYNLNLVKDRDLIKKQILLNKQKVYEYAALGENVYILDVDFRSYSSFSAIRDKLTCEPLFGWGPHYWASNLVIATNMLREHYCVECSRFRTKSNVLHLSIPHYGALQLLTGNERVNLPSIYRNYRKHYYIPYYGNSILDNVNPEFLTKDPVSRDNPNGLSWELHICGKCFRTYKHNFRRFNNALIIFSSKKNEVIDIVDYDIYKEQNKQDLGNVSVNVH